MSFEVIARSMSPEEETAEPVETKITGSVPSWLNGSLYRNGSGIFEIGDIKMNHLFDGFSVLSRYDIKDGKVFYKNRILRSDTWNESIKANRLVYGQFGTLEIPDPCKNIFSRFLSYFKVDATDNTSVNIVKHGDAIFTMTETDKIFQVDPDTLDPVDKVHLGKMISVHSSTAHPHTDQDGVMYNLASNYQNRNMAYCITASDPDQDGNAKPFDNLRIIGSVPSRWRSCHSYNHSFAMSENYFVILEQNVCIDLLKAAFAKVLRNPYVDCIKIYDQEELQVAVLEKRNGQQLKTVYRMNNFFCFHHINSYEEDGHLIVDLCSYDDTNIIGRACIEAIRNRELLNSKSCFKRIVIPLNVADNAPVGVNLITLKDSKATAMKRKDGSIFLTSDYLTDDPADEKSRFEFELPTFNYAKHVARPYRYAYGCNLQDKINKIDTVLRSMKIYQDPKGNCVGEAIFVPSPNATEEDDGVLLVPVISTDRQSPCYLTILNAQTMQEMARCDVPVSTVIPTSFHGFFDKKMPST